MAHRADDLTPLFTAAPTAQVGYRQGVLLTYTTGTAANTVDIGGGTVLTDLPILVTAGLTVGAAVGLLTIGGPAAQSWLILGRITAPA